MDQVDQREIGQKTSHGLPATSGPDVDQDVDHVDRAVTL